MSKSIEDLEMMITHQEKQIQELNDVVIAQGKDIDSLKKYLKNQKSKIQELEESVGDLGGEKFQSIADEAAANKPPHY